MLRSAESAGKERLSDSVGLVTPVHLALQSYWCPSCILSTAPSTRQGGRARALMFRSAATQPLSDVISLIMPVHVLQCIVLFAHCILLCSLFHIQDSRGAFACHSLSLLFVPLLFLLSQLVHSTYAFCLCSDPSFHACIDKLCELLRPMITSRARV